MSTASGLAKWATDQLLEGGQTERITFRKFDGKALSAAAEGTGEFTSNDVETVVLAVNPQEWRWNGAKLINKVPTNAQERFVVFDWGNDLVSMSMTGVTGNLLPTAITKGLNPAGGVIESVSAYFNADKVSSSLQTYNKVAGTATSVATKLMQRNMSYFELLAMSPKYRTFKKLQKMYQNMDADSDILTLEFGEQVFRGYFAEFDFTVSADSPWNWKYDLQFVSIDDLSQTERRNDEKIDNGVIDKTS